MDFKKRISLYSLKEYNPYPNVSSSINLSSFSAHQISSLSSSLTLSFNDENLSDVNTWQNAAKNKLIELMAYKPSVGEVEEKYKKDLASVKRIKRTRYYLASFDGNDIPVTILWSEEVHLHSIMICLAGSASGVHLLWGEALMPSDPARLLTGADVGLQAVNNGFLAVCIEQRCYGEREERKLEPRSDARCVDAVMHALLLGQTLIGEKVNDVSTVISWLKSCELPVNVNREKIWLYGHSAGGTNAVYSAAVDERISGVIASGCINPISESVLMRRDPEGHSIIPGILKWLEFHDLICLCAPRPFIAIGGKSDHIFPYEGLQKVIEEASKVYQALDAKNNIHVLSGEGGHRMYTEKMWPYLKKYFPDMQC